MTEQQSKEKTEEKIYDEERRRREREKERQEEKKAKPESKPETKKEKTILPVKVETPIVESDEPAIVEKKLEIDREIPDIKEEEPKISIPIIELEKPGIELKEFVLDRVLPEIKVAERKLEIPLIRLNRPREVRSTITSFDTRVPQIRPVIRRISRVPIYRISSGSAVREVVSSFEIRVDSQILQRIKKEKIQVERQEKVGVSAGGGMDGGPSSGGEKVEEIPDIMDFVFGVSSTKISSKGPKVILYKELEEDSTIGSFETLCIRIYREKQGGKPKLQPIKKLDEFNIREIERWIRADRKIVTIDLDNDKEEDVKEWFCKDNLKELLRRANSIGDIGFIIFKTRSAELYKPCKTELEDSKNEIEHPLNVVYVEPKMLPSLKKRELSSLAWGNLKLDETCGPSIKPANFERPFGYEVFDDIFNKHSKPSFEEYLKNLKEENGGAYCDATKSHEEESMEHKEMKWFVVKYLTKRLIKEGKLKPLNPKKPKAFEINEHIKTEDDTEEELNGKVADVMYGSEVYEIETLFAEDGEGKIPREKINKTIDKYKGIDSIKKIKIVLDNLTFIRHLNMLKDIKPNKHEDERKKLEFYTLDIQKNELIPLKEVIKKVGQLCS